MAELINLQHARTQKEALQEAEEFYALLRGWEIEDSEAGLLHSDVLELITELLRFIHLPVDFVVEHIRDYDDERRAG